MRLAGILNAIFSGNVAIASATPPPVASIAGNVDTVSKTICDKVYSVKVTGSSKMTLLDLGAAYPAQTMTVMIPGEARSKFTTAPESIFYGKQICVTGKVINYKGKPEIVVTDPSQIKIQ